MKIAIVGATGAVGLEILKILEQRKFSVSDLKLFASPRSEGKSLEFAKRKYTVQSLKPGCFQGAEICFFDASDDVSRTWVPEALRAGAFVIDNSSVFRLDPSIPLCVPEVNGELLGSSRLKETRLVSGPNCTTVQLVLPLKILDQLFGLKRVFVSTYQSVSGAGTAAISEFKEQKSQWVQGLDSRNQVLPYVIANNCVPRIGSIGKNGFSSEENKIMDESKKILGLPHLKIAATSVRIPIDRAHSESVQVECERTPDLNIWIQALKAEKSIRVFEDSEMIQASHSAHGDTVDVGRVRLDPSVDNGLLFWVISDNLRKGAALNAVQIAETWLLSNH